VALENFLLDRFSTRTLYFFSNFIYAICVSCIYYVDKVYFILPLYSTAGLVLTVNQTLPYQLLADYHKNKEFRRQSAQGTKRGLGVDCSLLSCMFFASQALVSLFMSLLTASLGNSVILISSALCALACCLCTAILIKYPEEMVDKKKSKGSSTEKN
jgi:solute carrier family 45 protein 1/2/4